MEPVRSLRDVFAGLAEQPTGPDDADSSAPDPRSLLAEYHDLPDELLVTAIGSYANTAPAEVAGHLAAFVAAPGADPAEGLDLLSKAPVGTWENEVELPDSYDTGSLEPADGTPPDDAMQPDDGMDLDHLGVADGLDLDDTSQPQHDSQDSFGESLDHHPTDAAEDAFDLGSDVLTDVPTDLDHSYLAMDAVDTMDDANDHYPTGQPADDHDGYDHDGHDHHDQDGLDDLDGFDA
jgi:hypothetical protein